MTAMKDKMMTKDPQHRGKPGIGWPIAIFVGTALLAGIFAGYSEARADQGHSALAPWASAMIAIALGAMAFAVYVRRHAAWFRQWSPRKRLYWISLVLAGALGLVSAILLQSHGNADLMSNSALTPALAIGLSVLWVFGLLVALIIYQRSVDDHERMAHYIGGLAGFYAFVFPCPVWWVLWRADVAPPVEVMPLFALSLTANALVYLWFKFR